MRRDRSGGRRGGTRLREAALDGHREADLEPEDWTAHQADQAENWQLWRSTVAKLVVASLVEEDAREQQEARYLGRQRALLSGVQEDWDRFADQTDRSGRSHQDGADISETGP